MSRAEDFYSHMLLRWGFRNWLKVGLHHSGEIIPRGLAAATLSCNHSANSLTCSTTFAKLMLSPYSSNIIPFFKDLLSASRSSSLSSTQNFLLWTAPPPCLTLLPVDFPPLLCPPPFTATVSALFYLLGQRLGEKRRKKAILTCFFFPPPQYKDYLTVQEERASTFWTVCLMRKCFWAWFDHTMGEKRVIWERLNIAAEHSNRWVHTLTSSSFYFNILCRLF